MYFRCLGANHIHCIHLKAGHSFIIHNHPSSLRLYSIVSHKIFSVMENTTFHLYNTLLKFLSTERNKLYSVLYGANSLASINYGSGDSNITRGMVDRGDPVQRSLRIYKSLAASKTNISRHMNSIKISRASSRISVPVIRELTAPDDGDRDGS
jgi:hypothetical protein